MLHMLGSPILYCFGIVCIVTVCKQTVGMDERGSFKHGPQILFQSLSSMKEGKGETFEKLFKQRNTQGSKKSKAFGMV